MSVLQGHDSCVLNVRDKPDRDKAKRLRAGDEAEMLRGFLCLLVHDVCLFAEVLSQRGRGFHSFVDVAFGSISSSEYVD